MKNAVKRNKKYGEIKQTYRFETCDKTFIVVKALNVLNNHSRNRLAISVRLSRKEATSRNILQIHKQYLRC